VTRQEISQFYNAQEKELRWLSMIDEIKRTVTIFDSFRSNFFLGDPEIRSMVNKIMDEFYQLEAKIDRLSPKNKRKSVPIPRVFGGSRLDVEALEFDGLIKKIVYLRTSSTIADSVYKGLIDEVGIVRAKFLKASENSKIKMGYLQSLQTGLSANVNSKSAANDPYAYALPTFSLESLNNKELQKYKMNFRTISVVTFGAVLGGVVGLILGLVLSGLIIRRVQPH